jgi:hypothetical protein
MKPVTKLGSFVVSWHLNSDASEQQIIDAQKRVGEMVAKLGEFVFENSPVEVEYETTAETSH